MVSAHPFRDRRRRACDRLEYVGVTLGIQSHERISDEGAVRAADCSIIGELSKAERSLSEVAG